MRGRANCQSSCCWPTNFDWYQTFHSSKESFSFLRLRSVAPTWSAVATTEVMKRSMSAEEARKLAVSPSRSS